VAVTDNIVETRIAKAYGHFGEWLQGRVGATGPIALISVQCPIYWIDLHHQTADELDYKDDLPSLSYAHLAQVLAALGQPQSGRYSASSNMQFGAGLGASTASLLAVARVAAKPAYPTDAIAKAIVSVEGASDPLMYSDFDRLLWASRTAEIVDRFMAPPKFTVLGGLWGQPLRTDAQDSNFPDISDLLPEWATATKSKNHAQVAEIATESFTRTSQLRGSDNDPTLDIAGDLGALGVLRAHTGSARGLLFKSDGFPQSGLNLLREAGYSDVATFQTGDGS